MMRFKLYPIVVFFFALLSPASLPAATVNASSCSAANVQSAINSASPGDTVMVPAGTCSWSGSGAVNIGGSANITLQGAGAGVTIINGGSVQIRNLAPPWTGSRITGFTFNLGGSYFNIEGAVAYRIDHNTIIEPSWGLCIQLIGSLVGGVSASPAEGLIDHNTLQDCRIVSYGEYSDTGGMQRWAEPLNLGTSHSNYIEDNIASQTAAAINNFVDSNMGGRYVARFNKLQNTYFEIHSIQGEGTRAARLAEIYNNTLNMNLQGYIRTLLFRGGTGMIFNNTFNGNWNGPSIDIDNVRTCHANHDGDFPNWKFCDGSGTVDANTSGKAGYVCRDQPGASTDASLWNGKAGAAPVQQKAPLYIFKNLNNSSEIPWGYNTGACENQTQINNLATQIVDSRDVYQLNPSFDGKTGVGVGPIASRPASCTTGVGYWATDQGSWNTTLPANTSGQLYSCTATNTWTLYYTPYTYPHPLQGGGAPDPPVGLQATPH
jgi:hypothetical protein